EVWFLHNGSTAFINIFFKPAEVQYNLGLRHPGIGKNLSRLFDRTVSDRHQTYTRNGGGQLKRNHPCCNASPDHCYTDRVAGALAPGQDSIRDNHKDSFTLMLNYNAK